MFFSTLFTLFGLGALCWILFNLAVYALPFAIGLTSGMYLYETGQGVFMSIIAGLFIGGFVAALGEFAFDRIRWVPLKLAIGLTYAVPAGIAGFHAAKGLAEFGSAGAAAITLLVLAGGAGRGRHGLGAGVGLVRGQRHVRPASAQVFRRTLNAR
jgi:hypothetical protein